MPTRLPLQAQKFIISQRKSGYRMRTLDINSIHHFVMNISLDMNDSGVTYSNIYSTFNLLYPVIGTTSISHGFNLINPITATATTYSSQTGPNIIHGTAGGNYLTYYGSPTHSDGYILLDGSTQYIDTYSNLTNTYSMHISYYNTIYSTSSGDDISTVNGGNKLIIQYINNGKTYSSSGLIFSTYSSVTFSSSPIGFFESSRNLYTMSMYQNGISYLNTNSVGTFSGDIYATLDPNRSVNGASFSNGNLSVIVPSTGKSIFSTIGKKTGKWYWEVKITWTSSASAHFGIANSSAVSGAALGTVNGLIYIPDGNIYYSGNTRGVIGSGYALNDTIGVALNLDDSIIYFIKNGVSTSIYTFSNVSTIPTNDYIYAGVSVLNIFTASFTANFGQNTFSYSVPVGYNPGLYDNNSLQIGKGPDGYSNRTFALMSAGTNHTSAQALSFNNAVSSLITNKNIISYATLDPTKKGVGVTLSNGNLVYTGQNITLSTIGVNSGKWYWEIQTGFGTMNNNAFTISPITNTISPDYTSAAASNANYILYTIGMGQNGGISWNLFYGSSVGYVIGPGNTVGMALDMDTPKLSIYINGVYQGDISPQSHTIIPGAKYYPSLGSYGAADVRYTINFGQNVFSYSVPAGYNPGLWSGKKAIVY